MGGMGRGAEKGRCLLHKEEENEEHILSKCKETQKWIENFLNTKWLNTDEEIAYQKITSCAKSVDLENLVRALHQTKRKWENKVGK
jgi:hypothetical protein